MQRAVRHQVDPALAGEKMRHRPEQAIVQRAADRRLQKVTLGGSLQALGQQIVGRQAGIKDLDVVMGHPEDDRPGWRKAMAQSHRLPGATSLSRYSAGGIEGEQQRTGRQGGLDVGQGEGLPLLTAQQLRLAGKERVKKRA